MVDIKPTVTFTAPKFGGYTASCFSVGTFFGLFVMELVNFHNLFLIVFDLIVTIMFLLVMLNFYIKREEWN